LRRGAAAAGSGRLAECRDVVSGTAPHTRVSFLSSSHRRAASRQNRSYAWSNPLPPQEGERAPRSSVRPTQKTAARYAAGELQQAPQISSRVRPAGLLIFVPAPGAAGGWPPAAVQAELLSRCRRSFAHSYPHKSCLLGAAPMANAMPGGLFLPMVSRVIAACRSLRFAFTGG